MQKDCSVFKIPAFQSEKTPLFVENETATDNKPFEFYQELTKISEEIEKCRLRYS